MAHRPASLKVRALQWLAQREHSPVELRAKLMRVAQGRAVPAAASLDPPAADWDGDDPGLDEVAAPDVAAEVDALMTWLTTHNYLSTERFVESRVHARQGRFGNQRITRELQQHGLSLSPDGQQALKSSELARAREVWQRKYDSVAPDAAGRVRQMRFLAGRGFSHEVVRQIVRPPRGSDED